MLISKKYRLSKPKTLRFLKELEQDSEAVTLFISHATTAADVMNLLNNTRIPDQYTNTIVEQVLASPSGAVIFWGKDKRCLLLPPFPLTESHSIIHHDFEPLYSLLTGEYVIALVLVRLGHYSIGIARGDRLIESKSGTGLVHARHRKGGSSQRRFERRRENQAREFLERVCRHVQEIVTPHKSAIDYIVYGGAQTTLLSLRKLCPYLGTLDTTELPPLLNISSPRRTVLETSLRDTWSTTVIELQENTAQIIDS